jgi:hypothetical protein
MHHLLQEIVKAHKIPGHMQFFPLTQQAPESHFICPPKTALHGDHRQIGAHITQVIPQVEAGVPPLTGVTVADQDAKRTPAGPSPLLDQLGQGIGHIGGAARQMGGKQIVQSLPQV